MCVISYLKGNIQIEVKGTWEISKIKDTLRLHFDVEIWYIVCWWIWAKKAILPKINFLDIRWGGTKGNGVLIIQCGSFLHMILLLFLNCFWTVFLFIFLLSKGFIILWSVARTYVAIVIKCIFPVWKYAYLSIRKLSLHTVWLAMISSLLLASQPNQKRSLNQD